MASPAENEKVVREALPKVERRAINQAVIDTAHMPNESLVGEVEYYVGCWPAEVKRVDKAVAALAALRAQAEAGERESEDRDDADLSVKLWMDASEHNRLRAVAAEARLADAHEALRPFVQDSAPRVHIIGRFEVVEVRVNKSDYDAARAALSGEPS